VLRELQHQQKVLYNMAMRNKPVEEDNSLMELIRQHHLDPRSWMILRMEKTLREEIVDGALETNEAQRAVIIPAKPMLCTLATSGYNDICSW